jgi:hypothetical protein
MGDGGMFFSGCSIVLAVLRAFRCPHSRSGDLGAFEEATDTSLRSDASGHRPPRRGHSTTAAWPFPQDSVTAQFLFNEVSAGAGA